MGTGLLYTVSEEYKNKNLIIDYERGEIIDPKTGEIIEDHLPIDAPRIIAEDYAEWESKVHYHVLIEEKERKLKGIVYNIGRKISAPRWLCEDVLLFLKRVRKFKVNQFVVKNVSFLNEKFILATFYVVALKRGLISLVESIGKMNCNENGDPCYLSRRRKDKEFHKYVSLILKLWFIIHHDTSYVDEVKNYIRYFASAIIGDGNRVDITKIIDSTMELLNKHKKIGSFRPCNFAAALIIKVVNDIYGGSVAGKILRELIRKHNVNEFSVKRVLERLSISDVNGVE